jgi:hypothetical protein
MNYCDGQAIRVGDLVAINSQYRGTVVGCVEDRTFLPPLKGDEWDYLRTGIMVDTDFGGLVHYPDAAAIAQEGIELLERKSNDNSA